MIILINLFFFIITIWTKKEAVFFKVIAYNKQRAYYVISMKRKTNMS